MLIYCPSCSIRYLVADSAIGPAGRKVRCANCKHSWFVPPPQDRAGRDLVGSPSPTPAPAVREVAAAPVADAHPQPPSWFSEGPRTVDEPVGAASPPDESFDPFAYAPPFRPRRNPARLWTMAAICISIALIGLILVLWFLGGVQGVRAHMAGSAQTVPMPMAAPLRLAPNGPPERQQLESGHEILTVTGRIENPSAGVHKVPDIRAELVDTKGRRVYDWVIPAPAATLAPGAMVSFDGVTVDVPEGAARVRLSFVNAAD